MITKLIDYFKNIFQQDLNFKVQSVDIINKATKANNYMLTILFTNKNETYTRSFVFEKRGDLCYIRTYNADRLLATDILDLGEIWELNDILSHWFEIINNALLNSNLTTGLMKVEYTYE